MDISGFIFRLKMFNEDIEFFSILIFLLFFPEKTSVLYYLLFAFLIVIFLTRKILVSKNIGSSGFTIFLLTFNIILITTSFFSVYLLNSILFFFDIFLISFYFLFGFHETSGDGKRITNIAYLISFFSFVRILIFFITGSNTFFFKNPILSGVLSGFAILILLYNLMEIFKLHEFVFIVISTIALYISGSKAAFLGVIFFSFIMILIKKKKLIPIFIFLIAVTFIIPNPIGNMFVKSVYNDPYSKNRIDIWFLSAKMFTAFPFTGVGPDNFGEVSQQFNFKQLKGPANYFKVPRSPHNDYLKIVSENGIFGLIFIIMFFFFLFRRILSGSVYDIKKILVLYLLFQSFLFNIIFKTFFFFLFLYLLRSLFPETKKYISNSPILKLSIFFILFITIIAGYIFPYISDSKLNKVKMEIENSVNLINLEQSAKLNPIDARIYYMKSVINFKMFNKNSNPNFFSNALYNLEKAKMFNGYFLNSYLLESDIFLSILKRGIKYTGLKNEILAPLDQYLIYNPFDPFVVLEKASINMKFGDLQQAEKEAVKALEIEPDFISAIYFLQKNFNYYESDYLFSNKVEKIRKKIKGMHFKKGTYLYSIFKIPDEMKKKYLLK